jgi:hypothetical protein
METGAVAGDLAEIRRQMDRLQAYLDHLEAPPTGPAIIPVMGE